VALGVRWFWGLIRRVHALPGVGGERRPPGGATRAPWSDVLACRDLRSVLLQRSCSRRGKSKRCACPSVCVRPRRLLGCSIEAEAGLDAPSAQQFPSMLLLGASVVQEGMDCLAWSHDWNCATQLQFRFCVLNARLFVAVVAPRPCRSSPSRSEAALRTQHALPPTGSSRAQRQPFMIEGEALRVLFLAQPFMQAALIGGRCSTGALGAY